MDHEPSTRPRAPWPSGSPHKDHAEALTTSSVMAPDEAGAPAEGATPNVPAAADDDDDEEEEEEEEEEEDENDAVGFAGLLVVLTSSSLPARARLLLLPLPPPPPAVMMVALGPSPSSESSSESSSPSSEEAARPAALLACERGKNRCNRGRAVLMGAVVLKNSMHTHFLKYGKIYSR